jgi:hypothetical protein
MSTGVSGANRSAAFRSAEPLAGVRARAGQCRDDVSSSEKREAEPPAPLRIQRHPASDDQEGRNRITGQPYNDLLEAAAVCGLFRVTALPLQSHEGFSQLSQ